jgi:hypothetical protein
MEDAVALQIKNSMNGLSAIKNVGVQQVLYDWLVASKVEVKLTATEFKFIPAQGETMAVAVTLDQLQALNKGAMLPSHKSALSQKLSNVIKQLIAADANNDGPDAQPDVEPAVEPEVAPVITGATLGMLPPLSDAAPAAQWAQFPPKEMLTAKPVKLRNAVMLYQPVDGSSAGSRYFMVAASQDVRVGARLTNAQLSIRIEGPAWSKYAHTIAALGFDTVNKSKDYASVHLSVGNDLVAANKTLGAILMGLGIPLETPIPNLKWIKVA